MFKVISFGVFDESELSYSCNVNDKEFGSFDDVVENVKNWMIDEGIGDENNLMDERNECGWLSVDENNNEINVFYNEGWGVLFKVINC